MQALDAQGLAAQTHAGGLHGEAAWLLARIRQRDTSIFPLAHPAMMHDRSAASGGPGRHVAAKGRQHTETAPRHTVA